MGEKQQYDSIGEEYISTRKGSIKEKKGKEFILKNINFENKIVLDLGCGHGEDIKSFEDKGAKEVYGIDSSEFMISEAKKIVKLPKNLFVTDILDLPFSDNQFDVVVAKHSLHYLSNLNPAWIEISRILKKEGILIFTVPHPFSETFLKESKDYSKREEISFNASQKFTLKFPSHTLSEYLTEKFLNLFEIPQLWEFTKQEEWIKEITSPVILGIKAIKR